jgi:RNA polymerase-binding transcription factor DksA
MTPASKGTQVKRVPASRAAATSSSRSGNKSPSSKVGASTSKRPPLPKKKAVPVVKKAATATKKPAGTAKKPAAAPKKATSANAKKPAPTKKAVPAVRKVSPTAKKTAPPKKGPAAPSNKKTSEKPAARKAGASGTTNGATSRTAFAPKPKSPAPVRPRTGPYAKDAKFLEEVRDLLLAERAVYQEQATSLRAEADSLALEREPGDVQFDEESGEGGTVTVDRERNLALSGQATMAVEEIDGALARIADKTYGYCERCYQAIPKPRLRALPYARLCVACKSGGLSRR